MALRLRKINEEDLEKIMKWRISPNVTKYMYTDPDLTMEKQNDWYKFICESKVDNYWIIQFDGVDIGVLSINDIDYKNKRCQLGHYIADMNFRGKGITSTLECNIYDYVFYTLKLNKLVSEVFEFNKKAIEIHKRFGSEIEGILNDHIYKNGEFYNVVTMGITRKMWEERKKKLEYETIQIENSRSCYE